MNEDSRKRNGIKHYQNSDYPSGSFEAAIQADREAELRSSAHLRLERHPSVEADDIEEMVPEFMHRDFFRSEEDALDAIKPSSRLRVAKKSRKGPLMVSRTPDSALPDPVAGYVAPPVTEDFAGEANSKVSPTPSTSETPLRTEKPLAPLRAAEPTVSVPPRPPSPLRESASTVPSHADERSGQSGVGAPVQEVAPQVPSAKSSKYSFSLVAALLLVMGLFMWREQTRPEIVPQEALAVPSAVPMAQSAVDPTPDSTAFRPTFLAVGPPVPSPADFVRPEQDPSDEISPALVDDVDESAAAGADASAQRAAILERMSESSGDSSAESPAEPSEELPWESELPSAPVRKVPSPGSAPAAVRPSAPSAAVKTPAKPTAPKKQPIATAADLFPIDEELPLNNPAIKAPKPAAARPAPVAAPAHPVSVPQVASPVSPDGYQIAEPNL